MEDRLAPFLLTREGVAEGDAIASGVRGVERLAGGADLAVRVDLLHRRRLGHAQLAARAQMRHDLDEEISEAAEHREEEDHHQPQAVAAGAHAVDGAGELDQDR
jgi:hypothetical protein